ncbi:MAG TPA: prolipoprotein diacylglyceryl transferase [Acidobacteriota bacterium]|nr:prolipoprotein diacylglyceryl transferase [Acidobacteriota bacterium]HQM61701.1 prolipoprotein diacylglyceryl transferase [Acidobacteriota bacterium]
MWPELFRIGSFVISPYGFLVAAAFVAGIWVAARLGARYEEMDSRIFWDFGLAVVLVALVGAKVLMVFTDPFYYENPANIFSLDFLRSAGVFYGGLIAALAWSAWYFHRHRLPGWRVADAFAPGIAVGHFFGRLGCFTAGCCHGRPAGGAIAVTFTDPGCMVEPDYLNVPLYPTQLIESLGNLLIFGFLLWLYRRKRFDGQIILIYLGLYSIFRFSVEFLRGDLRGWILPGFVSTSQFIAILLFLGAAAAYWRQARRPADPAA